MSKRKVLLALGLAAAAAAPLAVHAATSATKDQASMSTAAKDTIRCPITGEEIRACCCPLNQRK